MKHLERIFSALEVGKKLRRRHAQKKRGVELKGATCWGFWKKCFGLNWKRFWAEERIVLGWKKCFWAEKRATRELKRKEKQKKKKMKRVALNWTKRQALKEKRKKAETEKKVRWKQNQQKEKRLKQNKKRLKQWCGLNKKAGVEGKEKGWTKEAKRFGLWAQNGFGLKKRRLNKKENKKKKGQHETKKEKKGTLNQVRKI